MAVVDLTGKGYEGKMHLPRVLVLDANKFFLNNLSGLCGNKTPLIMNGCELVPIRHKEKDWIDTGLDKTLTLDPSIRTMTAEEVVNYATDPANRIHGILSYYQHEDERYGWLLPRLIGSRLPVAVQTVSGIINDGVGDEVVKLAGAIGMFEKTDMAKEDPKLSGLRAVADAIDRQQDHVRQN